MIISHLTKDLNRLIQYVEFKGFSSSSCDIDSLINFTNKISAKHPDSWTIHHKKTTLQKGRREKKVPSSIHEYDKELNNKLKTSKNLYQSKETY